MHIRLRQAGVARASQKPRKRFVTGAPRDRRARPFTAILGRAAIGLRPRRHRARDGRYLRPSMRADDGALADGRDEDESSRAQLMKRMRMGRRHTKVVIYAAWLLARQCVIKYRAR